ncbi:hypothetical protein ABG768_015826, partial [Culter alburnus]
ALGGSPRLSPSRGARVPPPGVRAAPAAARRPCPGGKAETFPPRARRWGSGRPRRAPLPPTP